MAARTATLNTIAGLATDLVASYSVKVEAAMVKACIELTTKYSNVDVALVNDCRNYLNDKGARHLVVGRIATRAQVVLAR